MLTRAEFIAFVRVARLAVVSTTNAAGNPEAALVEIAVTDAGELLLDTPTTTRKVRNIEETPRVALVVGWSDQVSIQVEGMAEILAGDARSAYGQIFEAQFPGSRAMHEDFTLIRVVPDWLRYYDAHPNSYQVTEGLWSA